MLIAYLDESYNQDFYFIGAAIMTQDQWGELEDRYALIRRRAADDYGVPSTVELHGHELMGGSGNWKPLRGRHREAANIYAAALHAAEAVGVHYLFRGVDVQKLNARYRYPDQPHSIVLSHLLERVNEYRRDLHSTDMEQVIIVADEISTQDEHKRQFESYQAIGTPGYRSSKLDLISAPIQFASSASSIGLQAIDLAVYLYRRRLTITETHPKAASTMRRLGRHLDSSTAHAWTWQP